MIPGSVRGSCCRSHQGPLWVMLALMCVHGLWHCVCARVCVCVCTASGIVCVCARVCVRTLPLALCVRVCVY